MRTIFSLPDLGEGLTESEVVGWRVSVGDNVELNQIIADVETAKAAVELPSPVAGVVAALHAEAGQTVAVGAPLVTFETTADDAAASPGDDPDTARADSPEAHLVGYGARAETAVPRRRAAGAASQAPTPAPPALAPDARPDGPRSTPPVRTLAASLGVDLRTVTGTGDRGLITRADIELAASRAESGRASRARETRTAIRGVRKHTAEAMVASAFTAPQVTVFLTVDVSATTELLARLRTDPRFDGRRLTILTVVAKAVCLALARHETLNSRWDGAAQEIITFGYVNLGIATATDRGLMVPNIKDAETLSLLELADAIGALVDTARAGHTAPADFAHGTITVTNIGVFGVDAGTPILNPGEAAILGIGAVRHTPWGYRGEVVLRDVLTLSLSFDHRLVDGEQGARFLTDVAAILHNPLPLLTLL
ncbi:MAG: 2-oxo acid dehydrogenase subunit E2 [Actinobacteria bacterium]|nr:2-oxo acid dehydrogenase subunit E2 [Actinomycetota bacterium]